MKKGYLLVFSTALISGLSIYLNKFSVSVVNPYIFTGLKNMTVVVLLILFIVGWGRWPELKSLKKKQWGRLMAIGLVGGGLPFLMFFKGLSLTSASQGAFIHKTMFVWVAILAAFFLKEKINRWAYAGLISMVLGLWLMSKLGSLSINWGDGLILLATLFWSAEQILAKQALKDIAPSIVAWGRMFFGFIVIFIFWAATDQLSLAVNLKQEQIGWVLFTAALLFGYVLTWYSGLKHVPATVATSILAIGFPATTLANVILDNQPITLTQFAGLMLITVGAFWLIVFNRQSQIIKEPHK